MRSSRNSPAPSGKRPQGFLAGVSDIGRMSGLRHSHRIVTAGHFSAHGMPDRPCVILPRAVLRGNDTRTRPRSPSWCPLVGGLGSCFGVRSRPQHGTGEFVEVAAGPRRVEGVCGEMRRGPTPGRSFLENHQPRVNKTTVLVCCRSASRHVPQGCKRRVRPATLPQARIAGHFSALRNV
jgi:hypothetical protein